MALQFTIVGVFDGSTFLAVLVGRPPTRRFAADPPGGDRDGYREDVYDAVAEQVARYNSDAPVVVGPDWGQPRRAAPARSRSHCRPRSAAGRRPGGTYKH
ncbi:MULTISPECIES: hypothetical protein [Halobacterium]|uniref:hypothetical protein n=1 Tax=Halobacterium TaxID=2239 RepID=UPI0019666BF2|nr:MULTISPECIES: hypothetical protein [Halobacterium]MDL0122487.1 hypothetical protein [Halobacterium salinarum]MDL0127505.1 hypothetical protein [Halobacterium salinarum]MDL0132753.1 hypothetical protein [Halobacterium salinarum]QRY25160.1 hypothetical protein JRZ79_01795 [Halobacterium sp. BOL4-2]